MLLLKQEDQWWTILAFWNVGWTVIQLKPLALGDGSNWKQNLKTTMVWTSSGMYLEALTARKKLKSSTSMKDVTSHSHLSGHFSNLGRERRKKMLQIPQRSLNNMICRKKNVNHHHLNFTTYNWWTLYHKNKCVWCMKGSDEKKSFSNNWKIDANINSFGMKRI